VLELVLLAAAEAALQEIYNFLENFSPKAADDFLSALDSTVSQIRTFPRSGSPYHKRYRRVLIPDSRHALIYSLEGGRVIVARIVDLRQDPEVIRRSLN
jgi:plasmid stabilization system protein ParE